MGRTFARFRNCWDTPPCPPRSGTRTPRFANYWRCTIRRTLALEFAAGETLFLGGFGDGALHLLPSPPAKEKSQMPCAALAAAERPQEQEKQDGPLQDAAPVRPQNILTSA